MNSTVAKMRHFFFVTKGWSRYLIFKNLVKCGYVLKKLNLNSSVNSTGGFLDRTFVILKTLFNLGPSDRILVKFEFKLQCDRTRRFLDRIVVIIYLILGPLTGYMQNEELIGIQTLIKSQTSQSRIKHEKV